MSEQLTKCEQYALLRHRESLGSREAARRVGYSGGTPSEKAVRLYEAMEAISVSDVDVEWLEGRLKGRAKRLGELKDMLEAARLLEGQEEEM